MKYLLFAGAPQTGKTSGIARLAFTLIKSRGFKVVKHWNYPPTATNGDFRVILEGLDKEKNLIRIYLNSATDTIKIIQDAKIFLDANLPVDLVISSVRDVFTARTKFFNIFKFDNTTDFKLEIPLGKVRGGMHRPLCLKWYEEKIDILVLHTLNNRPFNI